MDWMQLTVETNKAQADFISEILMGLGAISVAFKDTFDEAIFEPSVGATPLWDNTTISALFEINANQAHISTILLELCQIQNTSFKTIKERIWEDECRRDFHAMQFGAQLWVCPSWEEYSKLPKDAVIIDMDPGLAFGTGSHQTTDLCLQYLDKNPPIGQRVIDYGTGSGILAIAAVKLGARSVVAIDNDPQAVTAATNNNKANQVDKQIKVLHTDNKGNLEPAGLLIANILANPLAKFLQHFANLVKTDGKMVLSGILYTQLDEILNIYERYFSNLQVKQKDDWCCINGLRK